MSIHAQSNKFFLIHARSIGKGGGTFSAANIFLKFIHIKKLNYDGVGFLFFWSIMEVKITKLTLELRFGFQIGEFVI